MKGAFFIIAFVACPWLATAQDRVVLHGRIVSDFDDADGVHVINRATEADVASHNGGNFSIPARVGDTLPFAAMQFELQNMVVTENHFQGGMEIKLKSKARELDELIIVDYRHINEVSLGLVPKGQKQYTPAERKLATASSGKLNPMGLDPVINWISGRTAMLKKAYEVEQKETIIEKLRLMYDDEEIIAKFNIPQEHVAGFLFYVAENKFIAEAVNARNEDRTRFLLVLASDKYLKLLNENAE